MNATSLSAAVCDESVPDETLFCHFIQSGREIPISYGDLRRGAARFANYYRAANIERGEVILIILRHSPDLFYSFLGAIFAGAIPSFMPDRTVKQDTSRYWQSHSKLFARLGTGTLLTYDQNLGQVSQHLPNLSLRVLAVENASDASPEFPQDKSSPDETAFLQHSSGTTGLKKGVALTHRAVIGQVVSYAQTLAITPNDRIISWLPLYHDMGLIACFILPLLTHVPVIMLDPFEWVVKPGSLFDAIKRYRATLCWQPNFAYHHLGRMVRPNANQDLSSMRAWIDCSEPCRAETLELFERNFAHAGVRLAHLQVCYAMAETVFAVTQTTLGRPPRVVTVDPEILRIEGRISLLAPGESTQQLISAGTCLPGLQLRIVDDAVADMADGYIGEIVITGDFLFSGYFKLPEETDKKIKQGWYHTGDLGFIHQGELFVTGRKNDLIIVHGRNYYAHDLEFLVNQVPGVHPGRNVAAGWFRTEIGSEDVIIIAETPTRRTEEHALLADQIKQALLNGAGLLAYDVHLVESGWLIKTTSGKIHRQENLSKYLAAVSNEKQLIPS